MRTEKIGNIGPENQRGRRKKRRGRKEREKNEKWKDGRNIYVW